MNLEWRARAERVLLKNYAQAPVAFVKGKGTRLWDADGREYLDFCAGVAVCSTGHAHDKVVRAIQDQVAKLSHTSNLYLIPKQIELAERLLQISGLTGGAFFCNSGSEAVEASLKLARVWGHKNGGRNEIIAATNSFHGRTFGSLTATGQEKYRKAFHPLVPGIKHVPFGDAEAMAKAIDDKTAAILVEPIQGEGGVVIPPPTYLEELREICDENDILLMLDEVQTGIGRTGTWFAFQQAGIMPDVVAIAKGLGSGFPVGAMLASDRAAVFEPGQHASTFGGNPLACTAALATLEVIEEENVLENARTQGERLLKGLTSTLSKEFLAARGAGLLLGGELRWESSKDAAHRLMAAGLLVAPIPDKTIRMAPPLTVTSSNVEEALRILEATLQPMPVAASAGRPG